MADTEQDSSNGEAVVGIAAPSPHDSLNFESIPGGSSREKLWRRSRGKEKKKRKEEEE